MRRCIVLFGLLIMLLVMAGAAQGADAGERDDAIATFADGRSPLKIIHVATDGDDARGDGSEGRPFATLAAAARRAAPGTAIRLGPGEHRGGTLLEGLAGTAEAPIWIGGAPGAPRPVIRGGGSGLHLAGPRYVVVHDLEIMEATGNGINADDGGDVDDPDAAHHLVFRNLHIHDIGKDGNQDGLKLSGVRDFFVIGCAIERCGGRASGSGIDQVGCRGGLIARCTLRDLSGNGVQCKGGTQDVEIRWCRFVNAGLRGVNIGGSTGIEYFRPRVSRERPNVEARNIRVVRNIIEGSDAAVAFVGAVECVASGNTIVRPGKWVLRILQETRSGNGLEFVECGDNRFENNLVYYERSSVKPRWEINIGPGTRPESFAFTSNLWYAADDPQHSAPSLPATEEHGVTGLDPMFIDEAKGDYRLKAGSPAIGAARAPGGAADFAGRARTRPGTIGAFEF